MHRLIRQYRNTYVVFIFIVTREKTSGSSVMFPSPLSCVAHGGDVRNIAFFGIATADEVRHRCQLRGNIVVIVNCHAVILEDLLVSTYQSYTGSHIHNRTRCVLEGHQDFAPEILISSVTRESQHLQVHPAPRSFNHVRRSKVHGVRSTS